MSKKLIFRDIYESIASRKMLDEDLIVYQKMEDLEKVFKVYTECENEEQKEELNKAVKIALFQVFHNRDVYEPNETRWKELYDIIYPEPVDTEGALDEASSAQTKAFKQGGKALDDLIQGKAIARIKDPNDKEAAIAAAYANRPDVVKQFTGDRKENQATAAFQKKAGQMAKAGVQDAITEEQEQIIKPDWKRFFELVDYDVDINRKKKQGELLIYNLLCDDVDDERCDLIVLVKFKYTLAEYYPATRLDPAEGGVEIDDVVVNVQYSNNETPHNIYELTVTDELEKLANKHFDEQMSEIIEKIYFYEDDDNEFIDEILAGVKRKYGL